LDDARRKQNTARARRADADRLEELAEAEKEKRRAERSTNS